LAIIVPLCGKQCESAFTKQRFPLVRKSLLLLLVTKTHLLKIFRSSSSCTNHIRFIVA
jgi:hypothetical protein